MRWAARIALAAVAALAVACGSATYSDANFLSLCESRAGATRAECSCTADNLRAGGGYDDPRDLRDAMTERKGAGEPLEYAPEPEFRSALFDCGVEKLAEEARADIRAKDLAKVDDSIRRWFTAVREGNAAAICAHETPAFSRAYDGGAHRKLCADEGIGVNPDLILADVEGDRSKPDGSSITVDDVKLSRDGKRVSATVRGGGRVYDVRLQSALPRGWEIDSLSSGR